MDSQENSPKVNGTQQARKSILVVDGDRDVRVAIGAVLTAKGYSVATARDSREALSFLADREFDLAFLDLAMPSLADSNILEKLIESREKDVSIVALVTGDQPRPVQQGHKHGVVAFYVQKPFRNTTILEVSRYLLEDLTEEEKQKLLSNLLSA